MHARRSDGLDTLQEAALKKAALDAGADGKNSVQQPPHNALSWTVQLLAGCRPAEVARMRKLRGTARCIAVFRWAIVITTSLLLFGMLNKIGWTKGC